MRKSPTNSPIPFPDRGTSRYKANEQYTWSVTLIKIANYRCCKVIINSYYFLYICKMDHNTDKECNCERREWYIEFKPMTTLASPCWKLKRFVSMWRWAVKNLRLTIFYHS